MSPKSITIIVAAVVAVALAAPAHAQVDCADWNTGAFFEAAEVSDVTRCLQVGADLEARRDGSGYTPVALGGTLRECRSRGDITRCGGGPERSRPRLLHPVAQCGVFRECQDRDGAAGSGCRSGSALRRRRTTTACCKDRRGRDGAAGSGCGSTHANQVRCHPRCTLRNLPASLRRW